MAAKAGREDSEQGAEDDWRLGCVAEQSETQTQTTDMAEDEFEVKNCNGCLRNTVTGRCWIRGAQVSWALPNTRGGWCKDCHGCWRLMLSSQTTLIALQLWIRDPENLMQWEFMLIAYLSLRKEGFDRITESMVLQRKVSIEFVLKMLGIPLRPGVLVALTDMEQNSVTDASKLANMTTTLADGQTVRCLGYWRHDFPASACASFSQPGSTNMMFPWRATLHTEVPQDRDIVKTMWPDLATVGPDGIGSQLVPSVLSTASRTCSKAFFSWARSQLSSYGSAAWESIKESAFTPFFSKIATLQTELAAKGEDAEVGLLEDWSQALGRGKVFTKKYRFFSRAKKTYQLVSLHPFIDDWVNFLVSQDIPVHNDLHLLRLKVRYVCGQESESWSQSFTAIIKLGLFDVFSAMVVVNAEGWMRSSFFLRFSQDVEKMDVRECDSKRLVYAKALGEIVKSLDESPVKDSVGKLFEDLHALKVMFRAGVEKETVTAAHAAKASGTLSEPRCMLIRTALEKSAAGLELYAPLKDLIRRRAEDDIADVRLNTAAEAFHDSTMLGFTIDLALEIVSVRNARLVMEGDMIIYNIMKDCSHSIAEAIKLWFPLRVHEQTDRIKEIFKNIEQLQVAVDLALAWCLHDLCRQVVEAVDRLEDCKEIDTSHITALAACSFQYSIDIGMDAKETMSILQTSSAFFSQQTKVFAIIERTAACFKDYDNLNALGGGTDAGKRNAALRHTVLTVAQATVALANANGLQDPQTAFQDWVDHPDGSYTERALGWLGMVADLDPETTLDLHVGIGNGEDDGSFMIQLGSKDKPIGKATPLKVLRQLPGLVQSSSLVAHVRSQLGKVASEATNSFFAVAELDGIRIVPVLVDGSHSKTVVQLMDQFVVASAMPKSQLDASKFWKGEATTDPEFRAAAALDLMRALFHQTKTTAVDVGVGISREAVMDIGVDDVLSMCQVMAFVHSVVCVMLFLRMELRNLSDALADHVLRQDIREALTYGLDQCDCGLADIVSNERMLHAAAALPVPWIWQVAGMTAWLQKVRSTLLEVRSKIFIACVHDIHDFSRTVEKHIPKYDHFCNAKTFAAGLARKNLLGHPFRSTLGHECSTLFHAQAQLGEIEVAFGMGDTKNNPEFKDAYEHASLTFESAKKALLVIAGVNVALEYSGDAQSTEAKKLVDSRWADLPRALLAVLKLKVAAPDNANSEPK